MAGPDVLECIEQVSELIAGLFGQTSPTPANITAILGSEIAILGNEIRLMDRDPEFTA
jgi:hypothetical protein